MDPVLAVFFQKDRVGACLWRGELGALEVCEFWDHGPSEPPSLVELCSSSEEHLSLGGDSYPALQTLLRQMRPSLIITLSRCAESLLLLLRQYVEARNSAFPRGAYIIAISFPKERFRKDIFGAGKRLNSFFLR